MKTNNLFKPARAFRSVLLAAFTLFGSGALQAANFFDNAITVTGTGGGTVDLNTAGGSNQSGRYCWAIFALQGGVTITSPSLPGLPNVIGNVGVAQSGTLTMSNSLIGGPPTNASTVYLRTGAVASTPGSTVAGGILQNAPTDTILNTAQAYAYNAASAASGLARTTSGLGVSGGVPASVLSDDISQVSLNNVAGQINGVSGATYVLNLTNLILSGVGGVLTLSGDSTTNYVINVSKYLSMSSGSKVVLSGGLQPQNVLFNVRNTYGYDVTMSGAGTELNGIILAANRNVKLTGGAQVTGEVIARAVSLSGNSRVINPVCSP